MQCDQAFFNQTRKNIADGDVIPEGQLLANLIALKANQVTRLKAISLVDQSEHNGVFQAQCGRQCRRDRDCVISKQRVLGHESGNRCSKVKGSA